MRRTFCQTPWTSGLFRAIRRVGCWTMALAHACNRMPIFQQGRTNVHAVFGNRGVANLVILPPLLGHSNASGPGKSCCAD